MDTQSLGRDNPTQPTDHFGYIAYGDNELYHRGALISALKLLHFCPRAKIVVATDKPGIFDGYPIETLALTAEQKDQMSFGGRYDFGIKAACMIELLKRGERLLLMDTDMYPVGDISLGFERITPTHSLMWRREGRKRPYLELAGKSIRIGDYTLTGRETMWASGIVGVHRANLGALGDAYAALKSVVEAVSAQTPEQFCIGVALSRNGRKIGKHGLPIWDYSTGGRKLVARQRIEEFFRAHGDLPLDAQIAKAAGYRLWRTPLDAWRQRHLWRF